MVMWVGGPASGTGAQCVTPARPISLAPTSSHALFSSFLQGGIGWSRVATAFATHRLLSANYLNRGIVLPRPHPVGSDDARRAAWNVPIFFFAWRGRSVRLRKDLLDGENVVSECSPPPHTHTPPNRMWD